MQYELDLVDCCYYSNTERFKIVWMNYGLNNITRKLEYTGQSALNIIHLKILLELNQ